ncbi:CyP450 monooxygenase [Schizopora paradoxa]|uniref:CyP450 monooxygenase n=1 Tax=Schizopora paradoxa TaxID=27342 RepID=A0A0H2R995_9AGAM|nr:CyP450 monooxygenase [Schizopora paradoxa]
MSTSGLPPLYTTLICATTSIVLLTLWNIRRQKSKLPFPPGPKRFPFVGNLIQAATSGLSMWQTASQWGKTYGDAIFLDVVGFPALVLNSQDVAVDLLAKRSSHYSSRPRFVMPVLAGWEWTTATLPFGAKLKKHRAILQKFFLSPDVLNYTDVQQRNCHIFLQGLLDSPEKYDKYAHRLPTSILMMNVYGHEGSYAPTPTSKLVINFDFYFFYIFLDLLPWMQSLPEWFPGTNFMRVAREGRVLSSRVRHELYRLTKKKMRDGTAKESMTTKFLGDAAANNVDNPASYEAEEEEFADVAAMVYLAGGDTTSTAIMNLILAVLKFPETMYRAQEEIDRVVGSDRLPTFEDRDNLPYVNALWEVLGPFALPRCTTQDDEYRGYRIPAGTLVLPNVWAIANNPDVYPDPSAFKPERWLPGGANVESIRPMDYIFGYGRRICPGRVWVEHLLFITAASLLATFNIERALDVNGEPIPISNVVHDETSFIRFVTPSACTFKPRSEKAARLIREAASTGPAWS